LAVFVETGAKILIFASMNEKIQDIINESLTVKSLVLNDLRLVGLVGDLVTLIMTGSGRGNTFIFAAMEEVRRMLSIWRPEFSGRFYINRDALPSEALHCNTSYLTAVANDFSYDLIYSRLIKGIGKPGDILIGLSTSGNSVNIVKAFETAREKGSPPSG